MGDNQTVNLMSLGSDGGNKINIYKVVPDLPDGLYLGKCIYLISLSLSFFLSLSLSLSSSNNSIQPIIITLITLITLIILGQDVGESNARGGDIMGTATTPTEAAVYKVTAFNSGGNSKQITLSFSLSLSIYIYISTPYLQHHLYSI